MFKLALAALISAASMGCGPLTLAIEDDFTALEIERIEWSIQHWQIVTDSDDAAIFLRYDLHDADNWLTKAEWDEVHDFGRLYRATTDEPAVQAIRKELGPNVNGAEKDGSIVLVIDRLADEKKFRHVMLHELGHLYGIGHLASGLMESPSSSDDDCIDWLTLAEFCDTYHCGVNAKPSCK